MSDSKNDKAWNKLFEEHKILKNLETQNSFSITATQINIEREARLMTKFNHKLQLPKIFADNNLSILPTSRGGYIIGHIETFHPFTLEEIAIESIVFPAPLESLDFREITSEATAINCAFVSNILQQFTGEEQLFPTVSGRMSSAYFDFNINTNLDPLQVKVSNSQLEIDGGFEGNSSLSLLEAKNDISDDFLIRQLFYPYKLWSQKITKVVRPIFLTYSNGIFHLREYEFLDANLYNSISLKQQRKFSIREGAINLADINKILQSVRQIDEPKVPFPQANSFERVINLCELIKQEGSLTKEKITSNYDFDERQSDYYANAARYLGLITKTTENDQGVYVLTGIGQNIFQLSFVDRQLKYTQLILSHKVFKDTLELYLTKGESPNMTETVNIMKQSNLYNIDSEDTFYRRASSVLGWTNWILSLNEE